MSENKTATAFVMPSAITTGTRVWVDGAKRADESAKVRDAKFLAALVENYPTDTGAKVKASLSSAVKVYTAGRGATSGQQSRASKFVAMARLIAGLTRAGVDPETLPGVKVGDVTRDALAMVVNGEGGKAFAAFRQSVVKAADEGRFVDIPGLIAGAAPVTEQESASAETGEGAEEGNGTDESPRVAAAVDSANLIRTLATITAMIDESAHEYSESDSERIREALDALESSIHRHTLVPAAA
jgi:hypothetical protein